MHTKTRKTENQLKRSNHVDEMKILVFRTDIKTKKKVKSIKPLFSNTDQFVNWSVDTDDIDNVLRIEATDDLKETDIIHLMNTCGFQCEVLMN